MKIVIDLDGVICEIKGKDQAYSQVDPLPGAIDKIRELRRNGHYIIIQTARNMVTQGGNVGKVMQNVGLDTLEWLNANYVEYDEIYFGKPWGDVYIDDNAFRFTNWNDIKRDGSNLPTSHEATIRGVGWESAIHVNKPKQKEFVLIIPMAGVGDRFQSVGFRNPKPLISVMGEPMFKLSVDSLPLDMFKTIVFVCLEEHERKCNISNYIQEHYGRYNIHITFVSSVTSGQAETVLRGIDCMKSENDNCGVLIHNCDSCFYLDFREELKKYLLSEPDNPFIDYVYRNNESGSYSYLNVQNGKVKHINEKEYPTNYISTGLYYFESVAQYKQTYIQTFDNCDFDEYYISYMYNTLINNNVDVLSRKVKLFNDLGSPFGLYNYLETGKRIA